MSSIYHTEPPTSGKVVLVTSFGDLEVELWTKEAPVACRNFIQLCMEGYYDNTVIHRVIKTFMVQMGDPTGTGSGGQSAFGKPFKDEFHGRLRFNHRGQVGMANDNIPNSNRSQFFITLGPCEHLNKKHTIFGKVAGQTLYNLLRIGEVETDTSDRPASSIIIKKVEVTLNPFDDISPRDLSSNNISNDNTVTKTNSGNSSNNNSNGNKSSNSYVMKEDGGKEQRRVVKDRKLLSFGDDVYDDDEDENEDHRDGVKIMAKGKGRGELEAAAAGGRDAFDRGGGGGRTTLSSSSSFSTSNSKEPSNSNSNNNSNSNSNSNSSLVNNDRNNEEEEEKGGRGYEDGDSKPQSQSFESKMMNKMLEKRKQMEKCSQDNNNNNNNNNNADIESFRHSDGKDVSKVRKLEDNKAISNRDSSISSSSSSSSSRVVDDFDSIMEMQKREEEDERQQMIREKKLQFDQMRDDLLQSKKAVRVMTGQEVEVASREVAKTAVVSLLEQRRLKYFNKKKTGETRERDTLARLSRFTENLRRERKMAKIASADNEDEEDEEETYYGQVMDRDDDNNSNDNSNSSSKSKSSSKGGGGIWYAKPLKFSRHIDDRYRDKDLQERLDDNYVVLDPRLAKS